MNSFTVRHEIETLQKGGARPGDISVLPLAGQTRSRLLETQRLGTIHVTRGEGVRNTLFGLGR
jgi:hypothetical protein